MGRLVKQNGPGNHPTHVKNSGNDGAKPADTTELLNRQNAHNRDDENGKLRDVNRRNKRNHRDAKRDKEQGGIRRVALVSGDQKQNEPQKCGSDKKSEHMVIVVGGLL
jgi:hypothetical protein